MKREAKRISSLGIRCAIARRKAWPVIASEAKQSPKLLKLRLGLTLIWGIFLGFFFTLPAWSQPAVVQKSPADYAAAYDQQLPKSRETMEQKRLRRGVRQGAFARQMIKVLELEKDLPLTASEDDCIRLLTRNGIAPLKGWSRYAPLTDDDYTAVIGKAIGKELLVHEKAQEVCDEIVEVLNVEWQLYHAKHQRYAILENLIRDKSVFPGAEPRCPYGAPYRIAGFHPRVEPHKHRIRTPMKQFLYKEKDYLDEWFRPGPGEKKKSW